MDATEFDFLLLVNTLLSSDTTHLLLVRRKALIERVFLTQRWKTAADMGEKGERGVRLSESLLILHTNPDFPKMYV